MHPHISTVQKNKHTDMSVGKLDTLWLHCTQLQTHQTCIFMKNNWHNLRKPPQYCTQHHSAVSVCACLISAGSKYAELIPLMLGKRNHISVEPKPRLHSATTGNIKTGVIGRWVVNIGVWSWLGRDHSRSISVWVDARKISLQDETRTDQTHSKEWNISTSEIKRGLDINGL